MRNYFKIKKRKILFTFLLVFNQLILSSSHALGNRTLAINELKQKYANSKSAIELNELDNSYSLELKSTLNEFVEDLLPSELRTSELRTLATIAIKKKILQSDLILLRGSGAYDHIKELISKKFIVRRKQKDGRSYWLSLSEKFFQTFAVSNEYLSQIGSSKK